MSVFKLPKGVWRGFQAKIAKFWWGKQGSKRGIHWCIWDLLCRNKKDEGLGFRDLEVFNQALLAKTVWRIVLCPDSMVNKVIRAKYVGNGDWATVGIGVKPSQVWRGLVWGKELLCAGIRWRIGSVVPLCDGSRGDVAVWHFNENGRYSVKSGYWFGMGLRRMEEGSSSGSGHDTSNSTNIWSLIWESVPNKVKLFLWRACHAFLPCAERLFKRKIRSHARMELERKNSLRGSVREREEVCENGEDGKNNLSEQVATLFFDGACDSTVGMAGLGAIIMSGSGNQLGALAFPLTGVLKPHIIEALALWYGMKLSKQVGVSKLSIVGDAVNVIHAIDQSGLDLNDIGGVMDAVCSLKSEFE
ncbi:hypothetical protein ACLB2K_052871 [Fragaria x ananassa]